MEGASCRELVGNINEKKLLERENRTIDSGDVEP